MTNFPPKNPNSFTNFPCRSTSGTRSPFLFLINIGGTSGLAFFAAIASSAPNVGAVCTIPVPSSVVTKSPDINLNAFSGLSFGRGESFHI